MNGFEAAGATKALDDVAARAATRRDSLCIFNMFCDLIKGGISVYLYFIDCTRCCIADADFSECSSGK